MKILERLLKALTPSSDYVDLMPHRHNFGQWDEITIPIGEYPAHTKEMMRSCIGCRGVEMMFGANWKIVPDEYKERFRNALKEHNLHLLEPVVTNDTEM